MGLARVQQQLTRDIKRSPMKAAVLALLCVVALYFWAPLVFGWFGKEKPKPKATPDAAAIVQQPTQAGPAATTAAASVPWHRLVESIQRDPRMQSAVLSPKEVMPFGEIAKKPEPEEDAEQAAIDKTPTELDVSKLGLKLSSTMLGRRRVAVINGRPYSEGSQLEVGEEITLLVARVTDRSVLLEHDGQRFELTMAGNSGSK
jgi:hypothetical protein